MSAKLHKKGKGLKTTLEPLIHHIHSKQPMVAVGVLASNAERTPTKAGEAISNVMVAVINEFGLGVPERSFLRATFDLRKEVWFQFATKVMKVVAAGKMEPEKALAFIGERVLADVKKRIVSGSGIPPPNAPTTVAAKGSSRPLVDTAQLLNSLGYEVRSGKKH